MNADPVFLYEHRIRIHVGWRRGRGGGVAGVAAWPGWRRGRGGGVAGVAGVARGAAGVR
jgi:hypothetical protein